MLGLNSSDDAAADGAVGLTGQGAADAVSRHFEPEGARSPRTRSLLSVQDMLRALVVADGGLDRDALLAHWREAEYHDPDAGAYGRVGGREWFDDVGRPALLAVPGVVEVDGGTAADRLRFDGADPAALLGEDVDESDDRVRPLGDLRTGRKAAAERVLDARGLARHSDEYERVLSMHERVVSAGEIPTDELETTLIREEFDDLRDHLEALPGVAVVADTPDPAEIQIETMADVLEAQDRLDAGATEVWRHTADENEPAR